MQISHGRIYLPLVAILNFPLSRLTGLEPTFEPHPGGSLGLGANNFAMLGKLRHNAGKDKGPSSGM